MADSWEDWDDEEGPAFAGLNLKEKEEEALKKKFEDEDVEDEPKWKPAAPQKPAAKKIISKFDENRGVSKTPASEQLSDPVAEKERQRKLQEAADFENAKSLFGVEDEAEDIALDTFKPKSAKDFEDFGKAIANKYFVPYAGSTHYKLLMKQFCRAALQSLSAAETKDIETSIAGVRTEKLKAEKAQANQGKKAGKKATLNVGRGGGAAGLDDYVFDNSGGPDDDYDFM